MVTKQQVIEAFNEDFTDCPKGVELKVVAINLLRSRTPFEVCYIIQGADHDKIYLPDISEVLPYLNEEDLVLLNNCGVFVDDNGLAMYA